MVMPGNDSDILIEAEDRAGEQERLRHVIEQPRGHIVDMDHLVGHKCDTAHDEQHRTGILRNFEAFFVFHGVQIIIIQNANSCSSGLTVEAWVSADLSD